VGSVEDGVVMDAAEDMEMARGYIAQVERLCDALEAAQAENT
jgi:hypothetical protein